MTTANDDASNSPPIQVPSSPGSIQGLVLSNSPVSRQASTARLASSVPFLNTIGISHIRHTSLLPPGPQSPSDVTPSANNTPHSSLPGPGTSALAAAFSSIVGQAPTQPGTPQLQSHIPAQAGAHLLGSSAQSNYGSFERCQLTQPIPGYVGLNTLEDPEIVKRHLVQPSEVIQCESSLDAASKQPEFSRDISSAGGTNNCYDTTTQRGDDDEFSSLQLQGGDITRPIYKWTEEAEARAQGPGRQGRSHSFHLSRPLPENEILDIGRIKVPGGFRRNFIRRTAVSPSPGGELGRHVGRRYNQGQILTNNFIEFLTIYGHFAGEELGEDEETYKSISNFRPHNYSDSDDEYSGGIEDDEELIETNASISPSRRKVKERKPKGTNSLTGATLLLLKSFIGTGVLFLPRAYLNGGMLFSTIVLLFVAMISYYCFVLLIMTRLKTEGSFGDMGGILYGGWFRTIILISIVASQVGFVAAYIVFTSQNLQAFILAITEGKTYIETTWLILVQSIAFLPFSLLRDISKLGFTALIADALILFGLMVLYYFDIDTLVNQGPADIVNFNPHDWTLFIGTAIFTFEGIGLIIPIQESMKNPKKFPAVLGGVMIVIIAVFLSVGAISYAAFGSKTETVILLNLPQDSKLVNGVQVLYSLAILLSTPLQIFPAIRITENAIFTRSGRFNPYIKWKKNFFRFLAVMLCAAVAWMGAANLDRFVAIVGSLACVPLVYIYPPMLHLRGVAETRFHKFTDILLCFCGLIVMIYTSINTIKN